MSDKTEVIIKLEGEKEVEGVVKGKGQVQVKFHDLHEALFKVDYSDPDEMSLYIEGKAGWKFIKDKKLTIGAGVKMELPDGELTGKLKLGSIVNITCNYYL